LLAERERLGTKLLSGSEITQVERYGLVFAPRKNAPSDRTVDLGSSTGTRHQGIELSRARPVETPFTNARALFGVAHTAARWVIAQ
jgi:hypothetical protein